MTPKYHYTHENASLYPDIAELLKFILGCQSSSNTPLSNVSSCCDIRAHNLPLYLWANLFLIGFYLKNACLLSAWECTREDNHRNCLIKEGDYTFLRMMKKKTHVCTGEKASAININIKQPGISGSSSYSTDRSTESFLLGNCSQMHSELTVSLSGKAESLMIDLCTQLWMYTDTPSMYHISKADTQSIFYKTEAVSNL